MALKDFLAAVAQASQKYASQYGLAPQELQLALITTAGLEGGLGDTPAVGDGGMSHGRFQFHIGGGHGTTLLNQGWTIEDFYNDAKVVDHWAPLLAQSIANAKKQGYTGGEAIRQGAFALERPAEIYPADRFNDVLTKASGLIGQVPPASGGSGGGGVPVGNGDIEKIRRGLQQRALELWDTFQQTQSPEDLTAFRIALVDIQTFEEAIASGGSGNDAAQQAFENAITLGDFEGRQADRLYERWRDKSQLARAATEGEIAMRTDHNERNVALQEALNKSMTPGLLPQPTDAGYIAPNYERILNRWNERFGVGAEPPATFSSGIALPGSSVPSVPSGSAEGAMKGFAQRAIGGVDLETPRVPEPDEYPSMWGQIPFGKVAYNVVQGYRGKDIPGSRQLDERLLYGIGRGYGWGADITAKGLEQAGKGYTATKKKAKKWWNDLTNPATYRFGIPGYAAGTMDHPGGPALLNERGPETIIGPDGSTQQIPGAAQVMNLPRGAAVLPAGIPANEAYYFAQIRRGLAQGGANPELSPQAQVSRANDPQLQEKVLAALRRAVAAEDAAHPPFTPILGPGISRDYWQDWRPLTGVPAMPPQATKGVK